MDDKKLWFAAVTGLVAGFSMSCALYPYVHRWQLGKLEIRGHEPDSIVNIPPSSFIEDEIIYEQLTRNIQFFGEAAQRTVCECFVIVVGLGGVGSHAAHLLLRSGVGHLRLIDFDQVTLSSLNRHAVATREDVGLSKAECLAKHLRQILPEANIEPLVSMFTSESADALLSGKPDFVLDAIDNIDTKIHLLAACKERGIPVLCCAGAGAKADPTRIRIVDICESTSADPLARTVRHKLRKQYNIQSGIPVVLSTERPRCGLMNLDDSAAKNPLDYQIIPNFRVRTIPVLGTSPAIFGMAAAAHILTHLAGAPFEGEPIIQPTAKQYERQLDRLKEREVLRFGSEEGLAVGMDEIMYHVRELWRGFSARSDRVVLPGGDKGLMRSTADLVLTRWNAAKPATVDNLVLLTRAEADEHDEMDLARVREREPDFCSHVEACLARARYDFYGDN